MPLIFSRSFLATGIILIDVKKIELILRVQDDQVTLKLFKAMPQPSNVETCFKINTNDNQVVEAPKEKLKKKPRKVP